MITIFLVPFYTRVFLPSDYGVLSLVNNTFFLVGMFSICALDSAAGRWFYETQDVTDHKKTFASWFWFQMLMSVGLCVLMLLISPFAAKNLLNLEWRKMWFIWLIPSATLITNILPAIIWNWYRFHRKAVAIIVFSISQSLLTILLTLLFVLVLKMGIPGVLLALFISTGVFSIVAAFQLKGWLSIKYFSMPRLKEMLRFSVPLIPVSIAYWLLNSTDSYFINHYSNTSEVGLFAIGSSLAAGVGLFTNAFQQAWGPFAYSIMKEPTAPRVYGKVFEYFGVVSSILILLMFLFSPELLMIFTHPKYYGASWVASILSINIVLITFSYIASVGTNIMKNTIAYSKAVFIASVITIILDIILIPRWGKEGSAIATVIAQVCIPAFLFYKSQKLFYIPYRFSYVVFVILLSIMIGVIIRYFNYGFATKTGIAILYVSLFILIYRNQLAEQLKKMKSRRLGLIS